jgi:hypothetical protein
MRPKSTLMSESKFRQRVKDELRKVPAAERRTWDATRLMAWWLAKVNDDPTLAYGVPGDHWQSAHSAATGLFGPDVI